MENQELEQMMEEWFRQLDCSQLDQVLKQQELFGQLTFLDLVKMILFGEGDFFQRILQVSRELLLGSWIEQREIFLQLFLLVIGYGVLKNFTDIFSENQCGKASFFIVYGGFLTLLMLSIKTMYETSVAAVATVVDFMTAFLPVFATTIVFSNGNASAAAFYEVGYFIIYFMQLLLGRVFIPFVKAFFAVGIANYTMEEQRFSGMVEFVENIILTSLKLLTAFVFGLNIIKNAIVPLQDSIVRTTVRRSLSYIPGVGQTLSAASDLFFASGELIRNGVGIAALILLILISMKPMLQIGCYTLGYQLFLALVEPVSDKRMAGVIQVVAKGGSLLFKILTSCVVMIFITVAMTSLLTQRSW